MRNRGKTPEFVYAKAYKMGERIIPVLSAEIGDNFRMMTIDKVQKLQKRSINNRSYGRNLSISCIKKPTCFQVEFLRLVVIFEKQSLFKLLLFPSRNVLYGHFQVKHRIQISLLNCYFLCTSAWHLLRTIAFVLLFQFSCCC